MFIIVVVLLFYSISTILFPRIPPVFNSTTLDYRRGRYSQLLVNEIMRNRNSTKTITFRPFPGSGFGNHISGMKGILLLAILNDAIICVEYDAYFDVMQPSLSIFKCNSI